MSGAEEQRFDLLVASVKDYAIFLLDRDGRVNTWNQGAALIKGYTSGEICGESIERFYTPEDRAAGRPRQLLARAAAEGRIEDEGWRLRKDGSRFWADVVITAIRDAGGELQGFIKVTRDLTERREAEERLRRSEASLAATLYSIGDGVLATDAEGRVTRINPVAERLTGWREVEALGHPLREVFHIINEYTGAEAPNPVDRVLAEGVVVGLANHTALIARDGTLRPIADSGAPILDAQGRSRGAVLVFRDISDERRREEERLRLAQAQEAIRLRDEFLSIASHELKTPLTALQLQLYSLHQQLSAATDPLGRRVERAVHIAERLGMLIEALLDVSRIATGKLRLTRETFDLLDAVRETIDRLRESAAAAGCELTLTTAGSLPGRWDRLRIEQVLSNLVANAIKYAAGKPIEVWAGREDDMAVLRVRDHGPGIAASELPRVFERFERAASARHYGGMGLGLYVARQIAEAHGGGIDAVNLDDGGASFTVRLPLPGATG